MLVTVIACSAERYARPSGPAPRYEAAPVAPWDAGASPGDPLDTQLGSLGATDLHVDAGSIQGAQPAGSHEKVQENS